MSQFAGENCPDGTSVPSPHHTNQVIYVPPTHSFKSLDNLTKHGQRSSVVHSLIQSCGLESSCILEPLRIATVSEALLAHSRHYLSVLRASSLYHYPGVANYTPYSDLDIIDFRDDEERKLHLEDAGLIDDCPTFNGVWELAMLTVGGAVVASQQLIARRANVACWFDGGRHHARFDMAHGFCYLNDVVVACKILLSEPGIRRVLYIDIDVHHGDGVEESFLYNPDVTTVSFHLAQKGFYPGTGHTITPRETPPNYSVFRVPLRRGIGDDAFISIFRNMMNLVMNHHRPDVLVLQCGCDGVYGDPLGDFNLSGKAYTSCVSYLLDYNIPLLILGGGGYDTANAARVWADVLQTCIRHVSIRKGNQAVSMSINRDVPLHDDFFDLYGPDFTRDIPTGSIPDENTSESLQHIVDEVKTVLNVIPQ